MLHNLVDRRRPAAVALALSLFWPGPGLAAAVQEHEDGHETHEAHEHEYGHSHGSLHFTHPLIAESVSPDTKVRFDHQLLDQSDDDAVNLGVAEAEYAFLPSFSIEAGIPYSYTDAVFGNLEVALKFANFALAEHGVLLGYGVELGFPTAGETGEIEAEAAGEGAASLRAGTSGSILSASTRTARFSAGSSSSTSGGIGEAEWEVAPFLNVGFKRSNLEIVAWGILGVPFSQDEGEEAETEIEYNLSAMYHVSPRVQVLLELDGTGGVSGDAVGEDVLNLSPAFRWQILPDRPLVIGTSVGFPLTDEEAFGTRWATSLFWHF